MSTTTALPGYVSGWCGARWHEKCTGVYSGTDCGCQCHQAPPEVTVHCALGCGHTETATDPQDVHDAMEGHYRSGHSHRAGVASVGYAGKLAQAVCDCGWSAPDTHPRNHPAFEDARAHLAQAAAAGQVAV